MFAFLYRSSQSFFYNIIFKSLWNFGIVILLLWLGRKYDNRLIDGDLFLIYLIAYPMGRFLLEFLRLDPAQVGGININQTLMLIVALCAAGVLFWRHRRGGRPEGGSVGVEE